MILLALSVFLATIPHAQANYRLGTTVSDTWPTGSGTTYTQVNGVSLADAGGSSGNELLTAGVYYNGSIPAYGQLRIYHKTGSSLSLDQNFLLKGLGSITYLNAVDVVDIDGNGQVDTVFVGNSQSSPDVSVIGIYQWTGSSFIKERLYNFSGPSFTIETRGLAIWSNVGIKQMVTIGHYYTAAGVDYSQLGIWSWDGSSARPTKNALFNWTTPGGAGAGAQGYAVAAGDVDGDGVPEIVTVGSSTYNYTSTLSQMKVWGWTGSGTPLVKYTREWVLPGQYSVPNSVTLRDLNGDSKNDIIVTGQESDGSTTSAEMTIWSVDSQSNLNQLAQTAWLNPSPTSNLESAHVATGDIDGDGTVDIATAGYTSQSTGYYGTLRVWSLQGSIIMLNKAYVYPSRSQLLAITVGDVDKTGRQDVIVGGSSPVLAGQKGMLEVRDVAKVYGLLTVSVNSSPSTAGQSVVVTGTLANATDETPFASAQVLLEYSKNGASYQLMATVTTDSQGRYASSFTPDGQGSYTIRSTWNGDEDHMGSSNTATLTVNKASSIIVLSLSTLTAKPGNTLTISGYIYPASPQTITLTYTSPTGTPTSHNVIADNSGAFSDQFTVESTGIWKVSASSPGDANTAAASSDTLQVETQPEPLGLSLSLYGFIASIVAVGLSIIALLRRPKATGASIPDQRIPIPAKSESLPSSSVTGDQNASKEQPASQNPQK